jgi:hypothetical protein
VLAAATGVGVAAGVLAVGGDIPVVADDLVTDPNSEQFVQFLEPLEEAGQVGGSVGLDRRDVDGSAGVWVVAGR